MKEGKSLARFSVGVPLPLLEQVDQKVRAMVEEGRVYNRSDFVREALEKLIVDRNRVRA